MEATTKKRKSLGQPGPLPKRRCNKCRKVFSTVYSKNRHENKKRDCSKGAIKQRQKEKNERRKIQNKTYYLRRKWHISLKHDSLIEVLDKLLLQIPGGCISTSPITLYQLEQRLRALNRE
eukprot:jgi/Phyca11/118652/e_gw1.36.496.1